MTLNVLILDDDMSVRQSLESFFEDLGFAVMVASSAEDALEQISDREIDVAIVDLRLPGQSGEAFILQAYKKDPGIHFLIYTGSVDYQLDGDLRRVGISQDQVFLKPLPDLMVLVDRINNFFRR